MRPLLLLLALLPQEGPVQKGASPCRRLRLPADPAMRARLERFEVADREFRWELKETKRTEKTVQYWLTFPSAAPGDVEENNTVWCRFWQPLAPGARRPAAVVLHWLGGRFDLLEVVCFRMAEQGIPALMMYLPYYGPRQSADPAKRQRLMGTDPDRTLAGVRQAVLDCRRAGDWLAARPDVEPSRVGIVGISLGAVIGGLAAGVDDRFGRSVLVIGGGDVPAIIFHGSRETSEQKRKLEESGMTVEKLRELSLDYEPLTYAGRVRPEELLLINAEADEVIPKDCTLKLREAMGSPEIRWLKGGHYALLLQLGQVLKDIVAHLSRRTAYGRALDPELERGR